MADSSSVDPRWSDPWPTMQPAWRDPPWRLAGRVLTAWFDAPWELIEMAVSPALRPPPRQTIRARLRFYDLEFEALGFSPAQALAPVKGAFREAAVGVPTQYGEVTGDTSIFMWADSDAYVMWAREVFGWPLLRTELELHGDLWTVGALDVGLSGQATVRDAWGTAAISTASVTTPAAEGSPSATWLTPRTILRHGANGGELRELQAVRPVVEKQGTPYRGHGNVEFAFQTGHPLALLETSEADIDLVDGFCLRVGDDVEIL